MADKRYGDARHGFAAGLYKNATYGAMDACYVYTEAEHEEVKNLRALYRAMRATPHGIPYAIFIVKKRDAIESALNAIDGGTYNAKIGEGNG